MNKVMIMKALGLIGALATGAVSIMSGDMTSGIGIIAASLSSINLRG